MNTKYDVELPKTREEEFQESIFEWVKTERAGDVSHFKSLLVENGVEYVLFQDNTRVNSALLGDVVLVHKSGTELLGNVNNAFEKIPEAGFNSPSIAVHIPSEPLQTPKAKTPIASILEKSKKKKMKVQVELQVEVPSADVLSIIRENFEGSDQELYEFFISKIDKKKFVSAIINSVQNK